MRATVFRTAAFGVVASLTLLPTDNEAGDRCVGSSSGHFHIRVDGVELVELMQLRETMSRVLHTLSVKHLAFREAPTIFLFGDRSNYEAMAGTGTFRSIGRAYRSDVYLLAPSIWQNACWLVDDRVHDVVLHELLHVIADQSIESSGGGSARIPLWFNEGFAEYFVDAIEHGRRQRLIDLPERIADLTLDPILDWETLTQADDHLAYSLAVAAVAMLIDWYGRDLPFRIFALMRSGEAFDRAFREETGITVREFSGRFSEAAYSVVVCAD